MLDTPSFGGRRLPTLCCAAPASLFGRFAEPFTKGLQFKVRVVRLADELKSAIASAIQPHRPCGHRTEKSVIKVVDEQRDAREARQRIDHAQRDRSALVESRWTVHAVARPSAASRVDGPNVGGMCFGNVDEQDARATGKFAVKRT